MVWLWPILFIYFKFPFSKKAPFFFFGSPSGEIWPPKQNVAYVVTSTIRKIEEKQKLMTKTKCWASIWFNIVNNI
jgi:hypothetical protein